MVLTPRRSSPALLDGSPAGRFEAPPPNAKPSSKSGGAEEAGHLKTAVERRRPSRGMAFFMRGTPRDVRIPARSALGSVQEAPNGLPVPRRATFPPGAGSLALTGNGRRSCLWCSDPT